MFCKIRWAAIRPLLARLTSWKLRNSLAAVVYKDDLAVASWQGQI